MMSMRAKQTSVPCPFEGCGAQAGEPCRYVNDGVPGKPQRGIHGVRELKALGVGGDGD